MSRSYEIKPRIGGGFVLTMFEGGEEMGRGVYPLPALGELTDEGEPLAVDEEFEHTMDRIFADIQHAAAVAEGESWLEGD